MGVEVEQTGHENEPGDIQLLNVTGHRDFGGRRDSADPVVVDQHGEAGHQTALDDVENPAAGQKQSGAVVVRVDGAHGRQH